MNEFHYERVMNRNLNEVYMDLREHLVEIFELITDAFAGVPILYLNILPRPWWGRHSRLLASYIDFYISKTFDGMVMRVDLNDVYCMKKMFMRRSTGFRDNVMPGMLDYDRVHLNHFGYNLLTENVLVKAGQKLYFPTYGPNKQKSKN